MQYDGVVYVVYRQVCGPPPDEDPGFVGPWQQVVCRVRATFSEAVRDVAEMHRAGAVGKPWRENGQPVSDELVAWKRRVPDAAMPDVTERDLLIAVWDTSSSEDMHFRLPDMRGAAFLLRQIFVDWPRGLCSLVSSYLPEWIVCGRCNLVSQRPQGLPICFRCPWPAERLCLHCASDGRYPRFRCTTLRERHLENRSILTGEAYTCSHHGVSLALKCRDDWTLPTFDPNDHRRSRIVEWTERDRREHRCRYFGRLRICLERPEMPALRVPGTHEDAGSKWWTDNYGGEPFYISHSHNVLWNYRRHDNPADH